MVVKSTVRFSRVPQIGFSIVSIVLSNHKALSFVDMLNCWVSPYNRHFNKPMLMQILVIFLLFQQCIQILRCRSRQLNYFFNWFFTCASQSSYCLHFVWRTKWVIVDGCDFHFDPIEFRVADRFFEDRGACFLSLSIKILILFSFLWIICHISLNW